MMGVPIRIPSNSKPYERCIREEGPKDKQDEEQIGRRPGYESVKLGCSTSIFFRERRKSCQRRCGGRWFCHV
jgi:hypothetical protein